MHGDHELALQLFNSLWLWTFIFLFYKESTGRELAKSNCPRVRLLISRFCCRLLFLHPWTIAQVSVILCGSISYGLILMTVMGYEHLWCGRCSHAAQYNTSSYLLFSWSMLVGWLLHGICGSVSITRNFEDSLWTIEKNLNFPYANRKWFV
jgi:ABC-type uncharacterized transport system permease subunit